VASVEGCWKLLLCLSVPAGPKTDPLLAKAEPISDGGSVSGIAELSKKSNCVTAFCSRRENSADIKLCMVEQIPTHSPGRTPRQSRGKPEGGCDPVGSPHWSRLLAGPVGRGAQAGGGLLAGLVTLW